MIPEYLIARSYHNLINNVQFFPPFLRHVQSHAPSLAFSDFLLPGSAVDEIVTPFAYDGFAEYVCAEALLVGSVGEIERCKRGD